MPKVLYFILFFLASTIYASSPPLKIRIILSNDGYGLYADQIILQEALESFGHSVEVLKNRKPSKKQISSDINIFIEKINPRWVPYACKNWFIPNPEWYEKKLPFLGKCNLILCRTRESERIFLSLNKKAYFLGFTSFDCCQEELLKDFSLFFHLAGRSLQKGTSAIIDVWKNDHTLPPIIILKHQNINTLNQKNVTLIPHIISQADLRYFQNTCGIHLCPSETEGFGHYIMEALSAGSVVITTDAPPMNEFVLDKRCLVPYKTRSPQNLATNYYVDPVQLEKTIHSLLTLSTSELEEIGLENRQFYLRNKEEFYEKLRTLLDTF